MTDPEKYSELSKKQGEFTYWPVLESLGFKSSTDDNTSKIMTGRRNKLHSCEDKSNQEILETVNSVLLDYLRITNIKKKQLREVVIGDSNEGINENFVEYINKIVKNYKEEEKKGFKYLDVHWIGEESSSVDYNVENLVKQIEEGGLDLPAVKILGEAGTGKTTALRRIEYELARRFKGIDKHTVPVYIPLGELSLENGAIINEIENRLQIERKSVYDLLREGKITLLLDGYNEVISQTVQRGIAKEIDHQFRMYYPDTIIYISDRMISKNSIPILSGAMKLFLKEITLEAKMNYFSLRVDQDCYQLIQNKAENSPAYFNSIDTPLKMLQLVDVVNSTKEVPDDLTDAYIKRLIDREFNEKKEIEIRDIEDLLQALAIYMYNIEESSNDVEAGIVGLSRINVLGKLAEFKNKLGYNIDTKRFLDVVMGMHILCEENSLIQFVNREYMTYFMLEGCVNGLDQDFIQG